MAISATLVPSKAEVGVGEVFDLVLTATSDVATNGMFGVQCGYFLDGAGVDIGTARDSIAKGDGVWWGGNTVMDKSRHAGHASYPDNACIVYAMGPLGGEAIVFEAGESKELIRVRCTALAEGTWTIDPVMSMMLGEPWNREVYPTKAAGGPPEFPKPNMEIPFGTWTAGTITVTPEITYDPLDADQDNTYSLGDLQAKMTEALDLGLVTDPFAYMAIMQDCATIFDNKGETL